MHTGQYELDGLVFGTRSPWLVKNDFLVQTFDVTEGSIDSPDTSYPNEDGTKFGVDFHSGMTINFDIALWKRGQSGYDDVSRFLSKWRDPKFRVKANQVTPLRICRGGRIRRIYGRPRRCKPTYGAIERGWAPITADFQCSDSSFYDDEITNHDIGLVNPPNAGLTLPTTAPVRIQQYAGAYTNIIVEGDKPTWPVFVIKGPVTDPGFALDNLWSCRVLVSLAHDDTLVIDTHPWSRLTTINNNINASGKYTSNSPIMREMAFAPGLHDLVYTGIDPTLSSQLSISWRSAWSTP